MIVELIGGPMDGQTIQLPSSHSHFRVAPASRRQGTYRLEERDETAPPRMYWQGWDDEPVPVEIVQQPVQEQREPAPYSDYVSVLADRYREINEELVRRQLAEDRAANYPVDPEPLTPDEEPPPW